MKPIIGLCTNYSTEKSIGVNTNLGLQEQAWHLLADDYISAIGSSAPVTHAI